MENDEIKHGNGSDILKCVRFPPKVHSYGKFVGDKTPLTYSLPNLELQMVILFALTQLLHVPFKRLGIPRLLSEIMAGIILGPTFLAHYPTFQTTLFPVEGQGIVGTMSSFGFTMFMFTSGVKMEMSMLKRMGAKVWVIGLLNWVVSIVINTSVVEVILRIQGRGTISNKKAGTPLIIAIHATTSFPVVAQLLRDVKISNSELGRLALSSALINNLIGTGVTAMTQLFRSATHDGFENAIDNLVLSIIHLCLASFIFRPLMFWVAKQTPEGRPVKDIYVYLIILGTFLSSVFYNYINLLAPFGSFIYGLAIPEGHPLGTAVVDKLELYTSGILLPLFVSFNTLRTDLSTVSFRNPFVVNNFILDAVTFFNKIFTCLIATLYFRMPFSDGLALGLIMSSKGVVDLAQYTSLRDRQIFSQPTFSVVVVATALNVTFVPMLIRWLYNPSRKYAGYQKRNIMHTKQNTRLPIFICIHKPDNILAISRLLDAYSPSFENQIAVFVLHLIELRGRDTPIFISHKVQTKTVANVSYSGNVIAAFNVYEQNHRGFATVQIFTAISPRRLMHDDICGLALDTLTSIIIIPFHIQWNKDGSIKFDDVGLRTLNISVLERAPCSVGILIDRGHSRGECSSDQGAESITDVAVIFIGGSDDQEALHYANRMMKKSNIMLTVVHLLSTADEENEFRSNKERILESEMLKEMKMLSDMRYVKYIERKVKDGHETTNIIRGMVNVYNLIIVGRRKNIECSQTSGLVMWSEFPELGILGDLLASSDIKGKASGLVMQQQEMNC